MPEKLTWDEIKTLYPREWVELVDYDWDMTEPYPTAGSVRVHSPQRKEFDRMILNDPPEDSAIVFTGKIELPENSFISANLNRIRCAKI